MKALEALIFVLFLSACTPPPSERADGGANDLRQQPSATASGVQISGSVTVGVMGSF